MTTLLFCTSTIADQRSWDRRYKLWLQHHQGLNAGTVTLAIINDGAASEPQGVSVLHAGNIGQSACPADVLVTFSESLGTVGPTDAPGWWRSMFASLCLAKYYGFERIVYVDADARILSERLMRYILTKDTGWTRISASPNTGGSVIQVICKDAFPRLEEMVAKGPFGFHGESIDQVLAFTSVEESFLGRDQQALQTTLIHDVDFCYQTPFSIDAVEARLTSNESPQGTPTSGFSRHETSTTSYPAIGATQALADGESSRHAGVLAYQNGDFAAARAWLERADWLVPEDGLTCKFLAATRMQQGDVTGAIASGTQSARLNADDAEALNMAGAFNLQAGRYLEAIKFFSSALNIDPENSSALSNLALIDWNRKDIGEHFPGGLRTLELSVRAALMKRLAANQLTRRGATALLAFGVHFNEDFHLFLELARVMASDPQADAQTLFICGNALVIAGERSPALAAYRRAAALAPDSVRIQNAIGYTLISEGGAASRQGFQLANATWPQINSAAFAAATSRWLGLTQPSHKLLVYQEQGFGDALLSLRFLSLLKKAAIDAVLWLRPELSKLVGDQIDIPLVHADQRPEPLEVGADATSSLLGLIDALDIDMDQLPTPLPLFASAASVERFQKRLGASRVLRVGLCVFGNPNRSDDWVRSVPMEQLSRFAEVKGVQWINLSIDERPERDALRNLLAGLIDLSEEFDDFESTAGLITNLDLVVSIDSVIAHLAAALGKKVLLLAPTVSDWRWQIGDTVSPWWPTVEVFKAERPGDFTAAVEHLAARLDELASEHKNA